MADIAPKVPTARKLAVLASSVRDGLATTCGKAIITFTLAEIKILQADADQREVEKMFDNDGDRVPDKPWQTFDNHLADDPEKSITHPVTVASDVKLMLASLFIGITDLVEEIKTLSPQAPLEQLAIAKWRESNIVRTMMECTAQMQHVLKEDPMTRELDFIRLLQRHFKSLVSAKVVADPGADLIVHLFLKFLKVIAWHTAIRAYEYEHLTLNRGTFLSILGTLQALPPRSSDPRDLVYYTRIQIENWDTAAAVAKSAAAKPAAAAAVKKPTAAAVKSPPPRLGAPLPATKTAVRALPVIAEVKTPPAVGKLVKKPPQPAVPPVLNYDELLEEFEDNS